MSRRLTTAEILAQIPAARTRGAQERKAGLRATSARYDRRGARLVLELTNGFLFGIPVATLPRLAQATAAQLADVELAMLSHWSKEAAQNCVTTFSWAMGAIFVDSLFRMQVRSF